MGTGRCRRAGRLFLDTLLPRGCPGCGEELAGWRWVCRECRCALRPVPVRPFCPVCRGERGASGSREIGLGCLRPEHVGGTGAAAWWMEPPLDAVVHRFKYGGMPGLAVPLGRLVAKRVPSMAAEGVLAVPLHPTRRRERGYDQAELLAKELASCWGLPYVPGVVARRRATRAQARLPVGHRPGNVAEAFGVTQPSWVAGRRWVVIDDVATTGSTLVAVAQALRGAGAKAVVPVVLALA